MPDKFGSLTVRAYTAGGGLPVEGVSVLVMGAEDTNQSVRYELMTDRSGNTQEIILPTKSLDYSFNPGNGALPYSLYNVEVKKEGYYTKNIYGVSIFPGVKSLQLVNMIPLSEDGAVDFPRGSINTVIPKNYDL